MEFHHGAGPERQGEGEGVREASIEFEVVYISWSTGFTLRFEDERYL